MRTQVGADTAPGLATRVLSLPRWVILALIIAGQVVLALAIREMRSLAILHVGVIVVVGLYAVLKRDLANLLVILTYLVGSELLWRQVRAPIFYLTAPYVLTALSVFAVVLVLGRINGPGRLGLLFIALLLPASITTIRVAGAGSRELIAFALSGPVALAAFVMLTSQIKVAPWMYRRLLWTLVISTVGPLTIAVTDTREALAQSGITFKSSSNFVTAGGFGPVQVSSMLSAGALAAVLLVIIEPERRARILAAIVGFVIVVQTLLTFSRGGITALVISIAGLAVVSVRNREVRRRVFAISLVSILLALFFVLPWIESFTHGAFSDRFTDPDTGRTELAQNDLSIFEQNFVFGVGPGMTKYERLTYETCQLRSDKCKDEASSHTEFTRMLGEHGIPGIFAIGILLWLAAYSYLRAKRGKAFAAAWILWAIAQMFYANFRIVAVPFVFCFAFIEIAEDGEILKHRPDHKDAGLEDHSWDPDPPGRKRTIGFGGGYGPAPLDDPATARSVGFGAGIGPPNLVDTSASDER